MKFLICAVIFLFNHALFAQNTVMKGNTLPMVGYWKTGTVKNVKNTKVTTKVNNGSNTSESITVTAKWQVIDSTDKHYILYYTYQNFSFSNPKDSLNIAFAEIFKGITIKYRTNELGNFDTILNLNEILTLSKRGVNSLIKKLNWPDDSKSQMVLDNIKNLLSNPSLLENSISEDMVLIHYFYGLEYKLNVPYTYDSYMDNNLGGEPFPSKVIFKLTAINAAKDKAKFNSTITPDPKAYKKIIYETMSSLSEQMQLPTPRKSDFESSAALHKCEAEMSIAQGWPVKIVFTKISSLQSNKSTEVTTITLTV